ncbi:MAG: zinc-dependent alcohol dehydrogenase [Gemmataceae bacterium]|nr:zinc-dependent alcohol dehydrogenase [Gemmataceae bacterium]
MKAALLRDFNKSIEIEEVPIPRPKPNQALVKIQASGLCHTDIHTMHGHWPVKPRLPVIPGHEGVGIIESMGGKVLGWKTGDRVAISWLGRTCMECYFCKSGQENYCSGQFHSGYSINGCHAEYAVADARFLSRVPAGIADHEAAPLACAGLTAFASVERGGPLEGKIAVIMGVGGLGHLAIQYARLKGARVAAIDIHPEKLALAESLGCEKELCLEPSKAAEVLKKLALPLTVFCFSADPLAPAQSLALLPIGGTLVFASLPQQATLEIPAFDLVTRGWTIAGSYVGTRKQLEEVFRLHAEGKTRVQVETRPLVEIKQALHDLEKGSVQGRVVLIP